MSPTSYHVGDDPRPIEGREPMRRLPILTLNEYDLLMAVLHDVEDHVLPGIKSSIVHDLRVKLLNNTVVA
jgi:hypothetical protein